MSMSKKDYEVLGAILRSHYGLAQTNPVALATLDSMADSMVDAFQRDNVQFQRERFLQAATPDWHRAARGLKAMSR